MKQAADLTDLSTDPLASDLVVACESAWRAIQAIHPELPPVVMLLGTGVERGRLVKLGHWWEGRWIADGNVRGEVLLAGEALHLAPEAVFEVLLHEAAHGINAARGVKDTSRGGRYHNARFKRTALEVGLTVEQMDPYGFANTAVPPETAQRYRTEIERLTAAMRIARRVPPSALSTGDAQQQLGQEQDSGATGGEPPRPPVKPAECGCGRRLRMAPSVLAKGPVVCGVCGSEFVVDRQAALEQHSGPGTAQHPGWSAGTPLSPVHADAGVESAERLLSDAGRGVDGLDVVVRLGTWRSLFDSDSERPIPVTSPGEVTRWDRLARAVLCTDGILNGPGIELRDGLEVRAGDRLIVEPSTDVVFCDELPEPGTPGIVTDVRTAEQVAMVDFATSGVYAVRVGSPAADVLAYDYCELLQPNDVSSGAPPIEATPEAVDLGVEL